MREKWIDPKQLRNEMCKWLVNNDHLVVAPPTTAAAENAGETPP
jgi:hypothetical protein